MENSEKFFFQSTHSVIGAKVSAGSAITTVKFRLEICNVRKLSVAKHILWQTFPLKVCFSPLLSTISLSLFSKNVAIHSYPHMSQMIFVPFTIMKRP